MQTIMSQHPTIILLRFMIVGTIVPYYNSKKLYYRSIMTVKIFSAGSMEGFASQQLRQDVSACLSFLDSSRAAHLGFLVLIHRDGKKY